MHHNMIIDSEYNYKNKKMFDYKDRKNLEFLMLIYWRPNIIAPFLSTPVLTVRSWR